MIFINLEKAKTIAHNIRRELRSNEFLPLDEKIAKQIPGINFQGIEAQRQIVRDKYFEMQIKIDDSTNVAELKSAINM